MKEKKISTTTIMKEGSIQLPQEALDKLNLKEGDYIQFEDVSESPNNVALQITKKNKTFVTVEVPTEIYDSVKRKIKKYGYDTSVDEFINNATTQFLKKCN